MTGTEVPGSRPEGFGVPPAGDLPGTTVRRPDDAGGAMGPAGSKSRAGAERVKAWRATHWWATGALVVAVAAGVWVGLVLVPAERARSVGRWRDQLSAMADDRSSAVDRWVVERLGDARVVAGLPAVATLLGEQTTGRVSGARDESRAPETRPVVCSPSRVATAGSPATTLASPRRSTTQRSTALLRSSAIAESWSRHRSIDRARSAGARTRPTQRPAATPTTSAAAAHHRTGRQACIRAAPSGDLEPAACAVPS